MPRSNCFARGLQVWSGNYANGDMVRPAISKQLLKLWKLSTTAFSNYWTLLKSSEGPDLHLIMETPTRCSQNLRWGSCPYDFTYVGSSPFVIHDPKSKNSMSSTHRVRDRPMLASTTLNLLGFKHQMTINRASLASVSSGLRFLVKCVRCRCANDYTRR